jgi:hypothetical protein
LLFSQDKSIDSYIEALEGTLLTMLPCIKKKLRRAEGGTKLFGVFRVKIHDFTQKKQITESPHSFSRFKFVVSPHTVQQ